MRAAAPGKLVLTGAYAVLEGAPAVVLAVDRYARADATRNADAAAAEVREALGEEAPFCDVTELGLRGKKLGLGSSAAGLVASLGAVMAKRGADLADDDVKSRIFARARSAHAAVQGGGSGVDVAASTYGGVLRYAIVPTGAASALATELPRGLVIRAYFSGQSVRTSDLRAQVDAFRVRDGRGYARVMGELGAAAEDAASVLSCGSAFEAVASVRAFGEALERLGDAADVPIVPLEFRRLANAAATEGAWFMPSGAGGGDVGIYCGASEPSANFAELARRFEMIGLELSVSARGVHALQQSSL